MRTVRFIVAATLALCAGAAAAQAYPTKPMLNTPAQFADWMKTESAKWAKVVKQANLKIQ